MNWGHRPFVTHSSPSEKLPSIEPSFCDVHRAVPLHEDAHDLQVALQPHLVAGVPTPLKNISQLGLLFPMHGTIKNCPNHQPVMCFPLGHDPKVDFTWETHGMWKCAMSFLGCSHWDGVQGPSNHWFFAMHFATTNQGSWQYPSRSVHNLQIFTVRHPACSMIYGLSMSACSTWSRWR